MVGAAGAHVLGIDLGTGGPKVGLVSLDGRLAGAELEPVELLLLPDGGAEQRPEDWWAAIGAASRRLVARGLVPVEDVVAVGVTTQWSGTVAVDRAGAALGNAIIWMDTRGGRYLEAVTGGAFRIAGYAPLKLLRWIRLTGGVPSRSGKDPIAHILFLKHERPDVYREAAKLLEPKDWVNLRLTGVCAASFDSIALHWVTDNRDIARVRYHDGLVAASGIARAKLPELRPPGGVLGVLTDEAAAHLGLRAGTPVSVGTPDLHSAAVGSGAVRDYEAHLYVGTSSWLTCHVPFKKTDIGSNMATLPSALPGRYFVANEQETAGACLSFLRDNVLCRADELREAGPVDDAYERFERMAARAPAGAGGLLFLPWLYGERTPVEDHSVRGGLLNLSLEMTRDHLIRAVFEGVAYNSRWLLGAVERFVGRRLDPIRFIGGGARSPLWCQIFADVLDRTILRVDDPIHANLRGAALLAAAGIGRLGFDEIGAHVEVAAEHRPAAENRRVYDAMYRELGAAYRANRGIGARLERALRGRA